MKANHFVLFLCFNLLWTYSMAATYGSRIIGGQPANAGQFPFAAAIYVQTSNSRFFCGGALYNHDWIITAGNCVYNAVLFTIQLGSNYLESEDPERMTVATSTYVLHPDFKPETIENDIGLIKFRRPIDYDVYLRPTPIHLFGLIDYVRVFALGWGQVSDSEAGLSNELQYVEITTIPNAECQMVYGNQITNNMVCIAGDYNEGSCTGDTGSPLAVYFGRYYTLAGVASFVSGNGCESTDPSGYTRTLPYLNWIVSTAVADED